MNVNLFTQNQRHTEYICGQAVGIVIKIISNFDLFIGEYLR